MMRDPDSYASEVHVEPLLPPSASSANASASGGTPAAGNGDPGSGSRKLDIVADGAVGSDTPLSASPLEIGVAGSVPSTLEIERALMEAQGGESFADAISPAPLVPPREPLGARLAALMTQRHWLLLPLCVALLWGAVSYRPPGENVELRVDDIAQHDIIAPHGGLVVDRELTERNRDAAAELVPPQYDVRSNALQVARSELRELLAVIGPEVKAADLARSARPPVAATAARQTPGAPLESPAMRVRRINAKLVRPIPARAAQQILKTAEKRWPAVAHEAMVALTAAYEANGRSLKIRSDVADDRLAARRRVLAAVRARERRSGLTPAEAEAAFLLTSSVELAPNLVVNGDKTEHAREAARENVAKVLRHVEPGSVVVQAGTRIDIERRSELEDLDVVTPSFAWQSAFARLALCIVVVCFAAGYIARMHPQLEKQPASLWLAAMVPIAFVAIFRWALRAPYGDLSMVPIGAIAALLLTMLINERMGLLAAFSVPALCALIARAEPGLFLASALSAAVGVLGVAEISSRGHIARAALILAGTNAVLAFALGLLREAGMDETTILACWAAVAGAATVLAAVGLAQVLERPFNITTHLRLLDLIGANEPVMRRMQSEAPGTYTHSLMVSLLSEAAAKAVGADALLSRVGGLYHDIGKLRRPHCFVENQSGENVHDRLSPHFSALLIVSHVRDGIELGRALRLPPPVIDIIAQHHGTSLIAYFFQRAKSLSAPASGETELERVPDETLFRYPGPKPQSKEAAIVLLADTVEASSRALPSLTQESLNAHIRAMLHARQADGELDECDLTMRDLATIEASFGHVLRGVLHHRIEYPDPAADDKNWVQDALTAPGEGEARNEQRRGEPRPAGGEHYEPSRSDQRWRERRARRAAETHEPDEAGRFERPRRGERKRKSRGDKETPAGQRNSSETPVATEPVNPVSVKVRPRHLNGSGARGETGHEADAPSTQTNNEPSQDTEQRKGAANAAADNHRVESQRGALVRLSCGRIVRKRSGAGTGFKAGADLGGAQRGAAQLEPGAAGARNIGPV